MKKKQSSLEASLKYYKRKAAYHEKHYKIAIEQYDELEEEYYDYKNDPKNFKELYEKQTEEYRKTLEQLKEAREEVLRLRDENNLYQAAVMGKSASEIISQVQNSVKKPSNFPKELTRAQVEVLAFDPATPPDKADRYIKALKEAIDTSHFFEVNGEIKPIN